jgi:TPR repeat protein
MGKREIAMKLFSALAVGLMLAGPVSAQDYATALQNWKPLAEQGDASAQYNLGVMYANGFGVPQDYMEALKWWWLAADQGYADAQIKVGLAYSIGLTLPSDIVTAHMWVNIGAANGAEDGRESLDFVEENMTLDQILEAQRRARVCMASNYQDCD